MFENTMKRLAAKDAARKRAMKRHPEPVVAVSTDGRFLLTCLGGLEVSWWESSGTGDPAQRIRQQSWGRGSGLPHLITPEDAAAVNAAGQKLEAARRAYVRALKAAHTRGKDVDLETGKRIQAEVDGGPEI